MIHRFFYTTLYTLLTTLLGLCGIASAEEAASSFSVLPLDFKLSGSQARQQLIVSASFAGGLAADLTREATYETADPTKAVISPSGIVTPRGDGTVEIRARWKNHTASVQATIENAAQKTPIDFRTDAIAALSRAGCSQGACHGSPQGKGGFRLSLRGFDPDLDIETLTRESRGRRTNVFRPDQSLILLKGTAQTPHRGGLRFQTSEPAYQTLLAWISEGCRDVKIGRKLVKLETVPTHRALHVSSPHQQVLALAHFNDGTVQDVSDLAVFSTRSDAAYNVSPDGLVKFEGTAETTVLVRYLEQVRSVRLSYVRHDPTYVFRGPKPVNVVDQHIFAKQRELQLNPAPEAGDAVFLRRVYLDVLGSLPTLDETRDFLDSTAPDKRAKLIDSLLEREEYAGFWGMKWADIMRGNRVTVSERGVHSLHRYIVDNFSQDRPFNEQAREIVTGLGNTLHHPAANFARIAPTPEDSAESFAQLFLGLRMQCAKCHNHPFESLTQHDYYGLAAYFARVKIKGKQFGLDDEIVYLARQGEVQNPLTRKNAEPTAFGVPAGTLSPDEDRRVKLADWLVDPSNRMFARSTVNRIWSHLLGKGIVNPVDDFRDTNPPSHPELLDALAEEFVRGGYRFKPILRTILNSRTYQLSAENKAGQSPVAADPSRYFTQAGIRMMTAEQVIDAVSSSTGVPDTFPGYPRGTRAVDLAEGATENHFLTAMSRPLRDAACDCAREEEPALGGVLHLLNNRNLIERIESPHSRLGRWLAENKSTSEIVENLYLVTLTRRPTDAERKLVERHIESVKDRHAALQDVHHALLNSNEFLLRH